MPSSSATYSIIIRIEDGVVQGTEEQVQTTENLDSIRTNVALNGFRIAVNGSLVRYNLRDGVIDDFQDDSGILSGGNVTGGCLTAEDVTVAGCTITASTDRGASWTPDKAINDDGVSTNWMTVQYSVTGWLKMAFVADKAIMGYTLLANDDINAPKDWTLQGSDTGLFSGEESILDTQTGQSFAGGKLSFILDSAVSYKYYKLDITLSNGAGEFVSVGEIELLAESMISVSSSAETQPTNIHFIILGDDDTIELNTDLNAYASVDDGATWDQIILSDEGYYSADKKIFVGSVDVIEIGTDIKYKIECTIDDFKFYAVGLLWD